MTSPFSKHLRQLQPQLAVYARRVDQPIVPFKSEPTRWRWGIPALVGAAGAAAVTHAYYGGKAGMVVLLLLLFANRITAELMRGRAK